MRSLFLDWQVIPISKSNELYLAVKMHSAGSSYLILMLNIRNHVSLRSYKNDTDSGAKTQTCYVIQFKSDGESHNSGYNGNKRQSLVVIL